LGAAPLYTQGIGAGKPRSLPLKREAGWLAAQRAVRMVGPRNHDGTLAIEAPDIMQGMDATSVHERWRTGR